MMQSGLIFLAISGLTSGFGFAIAKITGSLFKFKRTSSVNASLAETPIRTSQPLHISANEVSCLMFELASYYLNAFIPDFLPL